MDIRRASGVSKNLREIKGLTGWYLGGGRPKGQI